MIELAQQAEGAAGPNAETTPLFPPRSYQLDLVELATNNNVSAAVPISSRYIICFAIATRAAVYTATSHCARSFISVSARPMFVQLLSADLLTTVLVTPAGHHISGHK
jgi:hypothetical protein